MSQANCESGSPSDAADPRQRGVVAVPEVPVAAQESLLQRTPSITWEPSASGRPFKSCGKIIISLSLPGVVSRSLVGSGGGKAGHRLFRSQRRIGDRPGHAHQNAFARNAMTILNEAVDLRRESLPGLIKRGFKETAFVPDDKDPPVVSLHASQGVPEVKPQTTSRTAVCQVNQKQST